ncbi:MAG TPA: aspartate-alanine antiporter [Burkholderiales bacterium]|nr:aspartate-alanine antiporter [Burkholderiales bacterium]
MHMLFDALRHHPEIALFLTLAIGYWFGALKFGSFSLGVVPSVLIAGLLIGQLGIKLPGVLEQTFFLSFLFAVGYSVGPQFFASMKKEALPQIGFTLIVCAIGFITAWAAAKLMGYGPGLAAGLVAGGLTNSGTLGVAATNITQVGLDTQRAAAEAGLIGIAYAVTLPFSGILTAWFLASAAPTILRVDLPTVSKELEAKMGIHGGTAGEQAYQPVVARAYRVANADFVGRTPRELDAALQGAVVTRFRQGAKIVDADVQAAIPQDATLVLSGSPHAHFVAKETIGPEVEDNELLAYPAEELDIVVTNKKAVGRTLHDLEQHELGHYGRRLFLMHVTRGGHPIPATQDLKIERWDVLTILGARKYVDDLAKTLGEADRSSSKSDVAFMGVGIVIGSLVGLLTIHVGGIPLGLSTGVGTLLAGLICGYLRAKYRTFGGIPAPALWVFNNVGLSGFIAGIGLNAAPGLVTGLQAYGISLVLSGIIVSFVPLIVGIFLGKYVFKFHPTLLLGAVAGARTFTPALGALQQAAQSTLPAIGYTLPYALARIILAIFGIVILVVMK